jgi:hypothetical protein
VKVGLGTPTRPESSTTIGCAIRSRVYPLFYVALDESWRTAVATVRGLLDHELVGGSGLTPGGTQHAAAEVDQLRRAPT